jgi:hypothetical protein
MSTKFGSNWLSGSREEKDYRCQVMAIWVIVLTIWQNKAPINNFINYLYVFLLIGSIRKKQEVHKCKGCCLFLIFSETTGLIGTKFGRNVHIKNRQHPLHLWTSCFFLILPINKKTHKIFSWPSKKHVYQVWFQLA